MGITHTHNSTFPSTSLGRNGARWRASFEMHPIAQGEKFYVFRAKMFQTGKAFYLSEQNAVVKVLRGRVANEEEWVYCLEVLQDVKELSQKFSKILAGHDRTERLLFVTACIAPMDSVSKLTSSYVLQRRKKKLSTNEYVLIESYIRGKVKSFISVIGKSLRNNATALEAFSHFTYWDSGGELVVCDLKGSRKGGIYTLTAPCIHSKAKKYGPGDMGEELDGIILFLEAHKCNEICSEWAIKHAFSPLPLMFRGDSLEGEATESADVKRSLYPSIETPI